MTRVEFSTKDRTGSRLSSNTRKGDRALAEASDLVETPRAMSIVQECTLLRDQ
jgi:hypothetical protein